MDFSIKKIFFTSIKNLMYLYIALVNYVRKFYLNVVINFL